MNVGRSSALPLGRHSSLKQIPENFIEKDYFLRKLSNARNENFLIMSYFYLNTYECAIICWLGSSVGIWKEICSLDLQDKRHEGPQWLCAGRCCKCSIQAAGSSRMKRPEDAVPTWDQSLAAPCRDPGVNRPWWAKEAGVWCPQVVVRARDAPPKAKWSFPYPGWLLPSSCPSSSFIPSCLQAYSWYLLQSVWVFPIAFWKHPQRAIQKWVWLYY